MSADERLGELVVTFAIIGIGAVFTSVVALLAWLCYGIACLTGFVC